jgi:hypothetical protein
MQKVESSVAEVIMLLQQAGAIVIGLTSRSAPLVSWTLTQLASLQIGFTSLWPEAHALDAKDGSESKRKGVRRGGVMCNGIVFCGENTKGDMLDSMLDDAGIKPELIVSVDDRRHHLESAKGMATKRQTAYIGLRYNVCDNAENNYLAQGLDEATIAWVDTACAAIKSGQDINIEQLTSECKALVVLEEARILRKQQQAPIECRVL